MVDRTTIETEVVDNATALTAIFGEWPSFHDAEVHSISLDREGPTLEAKIHVFRSTSEVDSRGYHVSTHHTLVTLNFLKVVLHNLRWFSYQNVLFDLLIDRTSGEDLKCGAYKVQFPSSCGVEMELICESIRVAEVKAFIPLA
jgi:hypothetical protein